MVDLQKELHETKVLGKIKKGIFKITCIEEIKAAGEKKSMFAIASIGKESNYKHRIKGMKRKMEAVNRIYIN